MIKWYAIVLDKLKHIKLESSAKTEEIGMLNSKDRGVGQDTGVKTRCLSTILCDFAKR